MLDLLGSYVIPPKSNLQVHSYRLAVIGMYFLGSIFKVAWTAAGAVVTQALQIKGPSSDPGCRTWMFAIDELLKGRSSSLVFPKCKIDWLTSGFCSEVYCARQSVKQ